MEKDEIIKTINDVENKSNKSLFDTLSILFEEYQKTKMLIIDLTLHLENIEESYNKINSEIKKRLKK